MHSGAKFGKEIEIEWIDSEILEEKPDGQDATIGSSRFGKRLKSLEAYDGILIPGGFGSRGSEGIINASNYARENNIPYLGICFGFQLAIVAFARNICNLSDANTTEINKNTKNPVVVYMPEQEQLKNYGGTMRLGLHQIEISSGSIAFDVYNNTSIRRRHRHRYEFNQRFRELLEKKGMRFTGSSDYKKRVEILEIPEHIFYFGIQYHGEFHSRPGKPEPSFEYFTKASIKNSLKKNSN